MTVDKGLVVAILVPITVAWIGGKYADASARRESNVRMVELAAGILQQAPSRETRALRTWATAVVDRYSDVRLSESARLALVDSLTLPRMEWFVPTRDGLRITVDTSAYLPPVQLRPR